MMKKRLFLSICTGISCQVSAAHHANWSPDSRMNANQFIEHLGSTYTHPFFHSFKQYGKTNSPQIDFEAATALWSFYSSAGVDFIFADEAIFTPKESTDLNQGELYLTDVNFYYGDDCVFYQNLHVLPFNVEYNDSYDEVSALMRSLGAIHKIKDSNGENWWALTRNDGQRYGVSFSFSEGLGVTEAKIQYYFGQDHMEWMDE